MKIYCSGIGGIGLSAYAALQNAAGHTVLGSDRAYTALTDDLSKQGITVTNNQDGSQVPEDADLFVYSEAISEDAPERVRATKLGIRQISYFAALGELSKDYTVIAVCGTHGKSTTTAMAAKVLTDAGLDPTVVVGTKVPQLDGRNWHKGKSDIFLLEACEYRGSFLHLKPDIILLTNIEWDHVDAYPTEQEYSDAYRNFIKQLPEGGIVIGHEADQPLIQQTGKQYINADSYPVPTLSIPGRHMQENAVLVCALAEKLGIAKDDAEMSLHAFTGTWRRFEEKGTHESGAVIVDDYAHHPQEIIATIASAHEKYPNRRVICLFQPHMHDRTVALYQDFVQAFHGAAEVWVTDVYEARKEKVSQTANIRELTEDIGDTIGGNAYYVGNLAAAEEYCRKNLQQEDVLLLMGAGDITTIATALTS